MAPLRPDPAELAIMNSLEGGMELANCLRNAMVSLAPGSTALSLALTLSAHMQESYVIRGGTGRLLSQTGPSLKVLLPTEDEEIGLAAWNLAVNLLLVLQNDDVGTESILGELIMLHRQFSQIGRAKALDQLSIAIARTATSLDIPVYRSAIDTRMLDLGQGQFRHMSFETMVEPASHFAIMRSRSKWLTLQRLRHLGLPTLPSGLVTSEQDAVAAAKQIGHAVVVKPAGGAKGRGVSLNLTSSKQVRDAFRLAAQDGSDVLVERFVVAEDYRLLVVGGRMIAAAKRIPAHVMGDGLNTVAQLIEALNADPRRGVQYAKLLEKVLVDSRMFDVLAQQSMTLESVPDPGAFVRLSLAANISQGGTAADVTALIHPDVQDVVERTARAVGLNVVGIDFLTQDISQSWREVGGWVLEVNTPPGLRPHWIANPEHDVVTPIVRQMFPEGAQSRIPTAGVTGSFGKTTTCQMIAAIAMEDGRIPGLSTTQGIWSGRFRIARGDSSGGRAAELLLSDPTVDLGIFELARGALLKKGMRIDGVDVAAVLNVYDNHLGLDGISTIEEMATVKSILVRSARRWVFLNADDSLVLEMRKLITDARLGLVSMDPANPAIAEHRQAGHCTLTIEGAGPNKCLCLMDRSEVVFSLPLARIPASQGGMSGSIAANALFATGVTYALGLSIKAIEAGLTGFTSDVTQNPGRHNRINGFPFEVILHWADDVEALADLVSTLEAEPPAGVRHLYMTFLGNRSDGWFRRQAEAIAGNFDRYYLADASDLRGRLPGEVPTLVAQELRRSGVGESSIVLLGRTGDSEQAAVLAAIGQAQAGDRIVIVTYDAESAISAIESYKQGPGRVDGEGPQTAQQLFQDDFWGGCFDSGFDARRGVSLLQTAGGTYRISQVHPNS